MTPSAHRPQAAESRSRSCVLCWTLFATILVVNGFSGHLVKAAANSPLPQVVNADYQQQLSSAPDVSDGASRSFSTRTPIRRNDAERSAGEGRRNVSSPMSTLVMLAVILGAAYAALLWFKRRGAGEETAAPEAIDVLCTRRLDAQASLHLVRIGRKVLAVGSTAGDVRTLAVIEDPEEIALLVNDRSEGRTPASASSRNRMAERRLPTSVLRDRQTVPSSSGEPPPRRTQ